LKNIHVVTKDGERIMRVNVQQLKGWRHTNSRSGLVGPRYRIPVDHEYLLVVVVNILLVKIDGKLVKIVFLK